MRLKPLDTLQPRLRLPPVIVAAAVTVTYAWIVISQPGTPRIIGTAAFFLVAAWGAVRFTTERVILRNPAISVGEVIEQQKTASSEGGYDYQAKYQFSAANGKIYTGNSGGTIKELPEQDSPILVVYNQEAPARNLPEELFWFYRFR